MPGATAARIIIGKDGCEEDKMREVRIAKDKLRARVQENRDQHRSVYERAIEGYRVTVIEWFNAQIDRAKKGGPFEVAFSLPRPEDHTGDYDRVLDMLDMSEDDVITLTDTEFTQYVRDDWGWKPVFEATSASYLNRA